MRIKIFSILILLILALSFIIFICPKEKSYVIKHVISPCEFVLDNGNVYKLKNTETFDADFTLHNKQLAKELGLTENEAFIMGNLGKYWAINILEGRSVRFTDEDILYYKFRYRAKFLNSPYSVLNGAFTNSDASGKLIEKIKNSRYVILDTDNDTEYEISHKPLPKNFLVIRKGMRKKNKETDLKSAFISTFQAGNYKIILTDMSTKLKPDRNCSTEICKEIVNGIKSAKSTLDLALYGYSSVPELENAIKNAIARGVKVRLVYDLDNKGENIYPDTNLLVNIIKHSKNDKESEEARYIMHNKFLIIDGKKVITGSANLSYTDMSGYNSNVIISLDSEEIAKIYKIEFEQMFAGKFHNDKKSYKNSANVYFSPQDKQIENNILPLIKASKDYIYIPVFVITERKFTDELINAKRRGVDVKIIADALSASTRNSKIQELRAAGIPVKIENWAGKMHSKTIIIDDKYLIIGSMNFSYSGENRNDENTMILNNSKAAIFYKNNFLYFWNSIPDKWLKLYPKAEGLDSIGSCSDGIDNDYDGLIDGEDDGCKIK